MVHQQRGSVTQRLGQHFWPWLKGFFLPTVEQSKNPGNPSSWVISWPGCLQEVALCMAQHGRLSAWQSE